MCSSAKGIRMNGTTESPSATSATDPNSRHENRGLCRITKSIPASTTVPTTTRPSPTSAGVNDSSATWMKRKLDPQNRDVVRKAGTHAFAGALMRPPSQSADA